MNMKRVSILMMGLCTIPVLLAVAGWNVVFSDGTNLTTRTSTATNALGPTASYVRPAYVSSNNTYSGGTTQAMDQLTATGMVMRGNIALNGNWLSGDGDGEGLFISSAGQLRSAFSNEAPAGAAWANVKSMHYASLGLVGVTGDNNTFGGYRAKGTFSAPTAVQSGDIMFFMFAAGYTTNWTASRAGIYISATENWLATSNGCSMAFSTTPNNGSTTRTTWLQLDGNGGLRMNNMSTTPTTGSGYGVIASSNSEVYVWDGSGNRTLISAENEKGEMVRVTDKPYGGFTETVNLSLLGRMMEDLASGKVVEQYAGKIYSSNSIPVLDWRANEARQEAEVLAAQLQWTPELGAYPKPYAKRPIPLWATEAQKQFDSKYVEAEK